ncbi:MAG TPA: zf-HC2 domain-containing protein [Actinomycetota bacterium]|nr:zf-HC2 domain-containing protein [Actinomycetota bacterium]
MPTDRGCAWARVELSARLDGETSVPPDTLDAHLADCASCRRHARELESVRRALRVQPAGDVPDLAPAIMRAVAAVAPVSPWRTRLRAATLGAAAAAAILLGASLPWGQSPRDVAAAGEIASGVRAAARTLDTYVATFDIEEHGWHPDVMERRMTARVVFDAPERLRLEVTDQTDYPAGKWPSNDSLVVANGHRWWIREATSCPTAALPECSVVTVERRGIERRQPFDGTTSLPTDIVVPLETIASSARFEVTGRQTLLDRRAHHVVLDYRHAVPLVAAIQTGGSWRPFRADDRVDVWVDAETWFPLRFTVSRASGERVLLDVRATSFSTPDDVPGSEFDARRPGLLKPGGWRERPLAAAPRDLVPSDTGGLAPHRAGTTADGKWIVSYARGMTWLKVSGGPARKSDLGYLLTAEEIHRDGSWLYYQPAGEALKRRVDLFAAGRHVQLESNLAREELLRVAASLEVDGAKLPRRVTTRDGAVVERIDAAAALERASFARAATYVPDGYSEATTLLSTSERETSVTFHFRSAEAEYGGAGIQVTQSSPVHLLTPTSEAPVAVRLRIAAGSDGTREVRARWFAERGVLEWIDGRVHTAVSVPFGDLATASAVAAGLR